MQPDHLVLVLFSVTLASIALGVLWGFVGVPYMFILPLTVAAGYALTKAMPLAREDYAGYLLLLGAIVLVFLSLVMGFWAGRELNRHMTRHRRRPLARQGKIG